MTGLPTGPGSDRRRGVRNLLLSFLIAISVLCTGWDARVEAHEFSDHHITGHDHAVELAVDVSDQVPDAPADAAHDPANHHHCPLATAPADARLQAPTPVRAAQLRPGKGKVLASDAIAPPLEPPLT